MLLIYGVNGYMGRMVAAELARSRVPFIAAGRSSPGADGAAEARAFPADRAELRGVTAVLNCAGPFSATAEPLAAACVGAGAHYLDLSGEVREHEAVRALGERASAAGVMLLPGAGFGCVPTEIAAALACARLGAPARRLVIAYETVGGASRGTLESVLRGIHEPGVKRRGGELVRALPGEQKRRLDLGGGEVLVVTNPWRADLVAAHASTGVADIDTLATFPFAARALMAMPRVTGSAVGRALVDRIIRSAPVGPTEAELATGRTRVLAIASGDGGAEARVHVRGPEAYVFTARAAAALVRRVMSGGARAGFAAPSQVLGLDGLGAIEGVVVS